MNHLTHNAGFFRPKGRDSGRRSISRWNKDLKKYSGQSVLNVCERILEKISSITRGWMIASFCSVGNVPTIK